MASSQKVQYSYVTAAQAAEYDKELMVPGFFTTEQLMELAGLSVAQVIEEVFHKEVVDSVVVVCGPGNNGGDGLVAARHLKQFGFDRVTVVYPKQPSKDQFKALVAQAVACDVEMIDTLPDLKQSQANTVVVDAIFGYSFKDGEIREPFKSIIDELAAFNGQIVSVDVPSGWNVDSGYAGEGIKPTVLISLMVPKLGVKSFDGVHYLGARFIPQQMVKKWNIQLPPFDGSRQFVKL